MKGVGHTFTFSGCTCKKQKKHANEDGNGHMLLTLGQMLLWMGSSSGKNHFFFTGYHAFANVVFAPTYIEGSKSDLILLSDGKILGFIRFGLDGARGR